MLRVIPATMIRSISRFALGVALCASVALPVQAQNQGEERVVAEVNDQAISSSDLYGRLQLALVSSGLPDSQDTRQRLLPQVLRLLIDESLQVQEAKKLGITVNDQEIAGEIEQIAQRNRLNGEQFKQALTQAGVPVQTLTQQIKANIAWSKLVQRRIRPTIQIGEDEVLAYSERIKANAGKPEYLVSEIFLAVDKPESEGEVRDLAGRLVEQIAAGANFAAVAQQFSQSAGAATGGDLGWIQQGQLEQAIDSAVLQLNTGQFSRPIRGVSGFHIMWVRDQRVVAAGNPGDIQVAIGQLVLPVAAGTDPGPMMEIGKQISEKITSCGDLQAAAASIPGSQAASLPLTRIADVPEAVAAIVSRAGVGQPTQPFATDIGVMILMVCDRVVPPGSLPPRDQIQSVLGGERLDMLQRRYLRNLRRDAFVEVRS